MSPVHYWRNTVTGEVGRETGLRDGQRLCIGGVWQERGPWVPATFDEWKEAHQ